MTTVFSSGPGFYAANSIKTDKRIPLGTVRIYCARIEAYDLPKNAADHDLETEFELLVAKAEKDPLLARALLSLHQSLGGNLAVLKEAAQR